jgi:hypothetical protein
MHRPDWVAGAGTVHAMTATGPTIGTSVSVPAAPTWLEHASQKFCPALNRHEAWRPTSPLSSASPRGRQQQGLVLRYANWLEVVETRYVVQDMRQCQKRPPLSSVRWDAEAACVLAPSWRRGGSSAP